MRIHGSAVAAILLSGALPRPAAAEPPVAPTETVAEANDACLGCHSDPELSLTLGDGTERPELPHPEKKFPDAHAMRAAMGEACRTGSPAGRYPRTSPRARNAVPAAAPAIPSAGNGRRPPQSRETPPPATGTRIELYRPQEKDMTLALMETPDNWAGRMTREPTGGVRAD